MFEAFCSTSFHVEGNTFMFHRTGSTSEKALIVSSVVANNYDAESEQRINHIFIIFLRQR